MEQGIEGEFAGASFSSLLEASERKNLFEDAIGSGPGPQSLAVSALPQGTVRKHFKGYEEVIIPPTPTAPMKPGEKLVIISSTIYLFVNVLYQYSCTAFALRCSCKSFWRNIRGAAPLCLFLECFFLGGMEFGF